MIDIPGGHVLSAFANANFKLLLSARVVSIEFFWIERYLLGPLHF